MSLMGSYVFLCCILAILMMWALFTCTLILTYVVLYSICRAATVTPQLTRTTSVNNNYYQREHFYIAFYGAARCPKGWQYVLRSNVKVSCKLTFTASCFIYSLRRWRLRLFQRRLGAHCRWHWSLIYVLKRIRALTFSPRLRDQEKKSFWHSYRAQVFFRWFFDTVACDGDDSAYLNDNLEWVTTVTDNDGNPRDIDVFVGSGVCPNLHVARTLINFRKSSNCIIRFVPTFPLFSTRMEVSWGQSHFRWPQSQSLMAFRGTSMFPLMSPQHLHFSFVYSSFLLGNWTARTNETYVCRHLRCFPLGRACDEAKFSHSCDTRQGQRR